MSGYADAVIIAVVLLAGLVVVAYALGFTIHGTTISFGI
jgi:hypothetical protein